MRAAFVTVALAALAATSTACGGSSGGAAAPEAKEAEHFSLRAVGFFREMRLDGKRLYGPDRELVSFPDAFRGSVGGARISINRVEPNRFRGTTDGSDGHVDLRVEPAADPGVVQVKGFWGGAPFGAFASPAKLSARGNKCPVVLDRVPGSQPPRYTGVDPCSHQPVEAMLPASYFELPLEDRALFLAFFLR